MLIKKDKKKKTVLVVDMPSIITKKLVELKPYWRNPRFNESTIPALVKSIDRYGFNVPLVIDSKGVLITGHARYKAALLIGLTEVPCIVSEGSEAANREFRILDNKIQDITQWDSEALSAELKTLFKDQDIINFFDNTLAAVLDIGEVVSINTDEDITSGGDSYAVDGSKVTIKEVDTTARCPYCDALLTKKDIVVEG